jgi:cytochrome P450
MVLGKGLITLDGDDWVEARRRVQQAFRPGLFAEQQQIVIRHTQEMIHRLQSEADGGVVDLAPVSSELMMRIALELLFGATPESIDLDQTRRDVEVCNDYVKNRVWSFTPESWHPRRLREFRQALQGLESIVERVIQQRRSETQAQRQKRCDVLSLLFEAGFSGVSLRDHVMTMMIAGHETTATAVSFAFALLARHADVQQRLFDEAKSLPASGFSLDDAPYTGAVWSESMRLYPAVPFLDRVAVNETALGPYRIPAGANLLWAPYCIHRKYWPDAETFDPQRFLDGTKHQRTNFIPFGIGPRLCIGKPLADMEGVTITTLFAQAFEMESADPGKLEVRPMITLQPKNGVKVRLHPRPILRDDASPAAEPNNVLVGA